MLTEQEHLRRYQRDQATRKARERRLREEDPKSFEQLRDRLNSRSKEWKRTHAYVPPLDPERRKTLQTAWRLQNAEKVRAYARSRYKNKHRGDVAFNLQSKLDSARLRARRKNIAFDLTPDDIVIPDVCPVLGIPLVWKTRTGKGERDHAPALDRIRNDQGYVKGNVRVISTRANRWKNDMTLDDAKRIVAYMELHEILA